MNNSDPAIQLRALRLRIWLLEQAFQQVDLRDHQNIFLLHIELAEAYNSYNHLLSIITQDKLHAAYETV